MADVRRRGRARARPRHVWRRRSRSGSPHRHGERVLARRRRGVPRRVARRPSAGLVRPCDEQGALPRVQRVAGGEDPRGAGDGGRRALRLEPAVFGISQLERVQRLRPVAEELGLSMAQLALAWVLREENVASAIIGASHPEQVSDNAAVSGVELDAATLEQIDAILGDSVAWEGPTRLATSRRRRCAAPGSRPPARTRQPPGERGSDPCRSLARPGRHRGRSGERSPPRSGA
jgi:Aldo/keto reductase family